MFKKRIKINFNHKSILSNINLSNTPSIKSQVMSELVFPVSRTLIQCVIEKLLTTIDEKENDKRDVNEITFDSDLSNVISFTDYVKNRDIKSKKISNKNTKEENNTEEENDNKEPESNAVNVNKVNLSNIKTPEQFRKNNKNTKEKEEFVGEISDTDIYITVPESDSDTYAEKSYQYNIQNDFLEDGFSDRLGKIYNNFSL